MAVKQTYTAVLFLHSVFICLSSYQSNGDRVLVMVTVMVIVMVMLIVTIR